MLLLTAGPTILLMAGPAMSEIDIDALALYDMNGDGLIDADERIALDIDIMNCRLDFDESAYADMLATDGTIILPDDIQEVALYQRPNAEPAAEPVIVVEPTGEDGTPNGELTMAPDVEPITPTETPENGNNMMGFAGCFAILGLLIAAYLHYRKKQ